VSVAMGNDRNDGLPGPPSSRRSRSARRAPGPWETVKRHPALVPLSEQHHHELAHARRLLRAAGAGPEEPLAVASAYIDAFFTETVGHFRREVEILRDLNRAGISGVLPLLDSKLPTQPTRAKPSTTELFSRVNGRRAWPTFPLRSRRTRSRHRICSRHPL